VRGWTTDLQLDPPATFRLPVEVRTDPAVLRQFRRFNGLVARGVRVFKRLAISWRRSGTAPIPEEAVSSPLKTQLFR
jgi:hypothetical protein